MAQSTTPQTPGVPAPMNTVWPPSNPSGTVIPFPLPWGQTGCCPPGGMDALMKCYCDIQQASAFIGQVMLDQINNNPAIIAAIIAGIEKSGSTLPTLGVTNGAPAQPGQVGEWVNLGGNFNFSTTGGTGIVSVGVLQPGDWDLFTNATFTVSVAGAGFQLEPQPAGVIGCDALLTIGSANAEEIVLVGAVGQALISVPTLFAFQASVVGAGTAGVMGIGLNARRAR